MNVLRNIGWFVLLVLGGCVPERARDLIDEVAREPAIERGSLPTTSSEAETLDESLQLELDALQRMAVARDPELAAMAHQARAMLHVGRAETELPPPELGVQVWNLRLTPPYDVSTLDMVMFELRQAFPPGGVRDAMGRAMAEEARAMAAEIAGREQELRVMVAERHAELTAAVRSRAVFTDLDQVLGRMIEVARARHTVEGTALDEVVRLEAERAGVIRRIERVDRNAAVARAALNALLQRPPGAPFGEPVDAEARTVHLPLEDLIARMERSRAVLGASRARIDAARARAEAARTEAERPDVMLGVTAWYSPMGNDAGVGGMVSVSLPWATGRARERAAAAAELEAGEDAAARGSITESRGEVGRALARLAGLERELAVLRSQVRPAAERSVEAMSAAFVAGRSDLLPWIDALRMALDVRMEEIDVTMELAMAVAELEEAVGEPLPQVTAGEEGER
jgi:outer membrane protein TolC